MKLSKSIISVILAILSVIPFSGGLEALLQQPSESAYAKKVFTAQDKALYGEILQNQSAWITGKLQLSNGAIPMYDHPAQGITHTNRVVPYFSCFAALGLLEYAGNNDAVKKYINWHFAHINTSADVNGIKGTIYDYDINNATLQETATKDYDSSDSYAALFLSLLRRYAEVTGDKALIINNSAKVKLVAEAMMSTANLGLTYAKPNYKVKYLMDNSEVVKGLEDATWLFKNVLNDSSSAKSYDKKYNNTRNMLNLSFWNIFKGSYYLGIQGISGMKTDVKNFYPDGVCQLYPATFGVNEADCSRSEKAYNTFCSNFPNWANGNFEAGFPWAIIAYSATVMGDYARADAYVKVMEAKYIDTNNVYPWYSMEAGCMMLATANLLKAAG